MDLKESILSVESVSKSFNGKNIIKDITIELKAGEIVSLLGVSGSGKTTVFNIVSGIMAPDTGEVFLEGRNITSKPGQISYMLQKDLLFEHKKIIDNVSLPLVLRGVRKKAAREEALKLFEVFGLKDCAYRYPCELSGGMRQRAALLRTYLASERVVLLDEPFSALDALTKASVHNWYLDIIKKLNLSTLLITHDVDEAILLSDRIYILSGQPAKISEEVIIDCGGESRKGFELTSDFIKYKKQITEALEF